VNQTNWLRLVGEHEPLEALLLGKGNGLDLSCNHREGGERDTVELIEATPETTLAHTLEDLGHISVLVFVRTVRDDDEDTKSSSEILHSLSLSSTGRASRGTTVKHTEGLGKSDVTSIGEGGNAKSLLGTKELIRVDELDIANLHSDVLFVVLPVKSGVLDPIEVGSVSDLVLLGILKNLTEKISLMHMDRHKGLDLGSGKSVHILQTHHGEFAHEVVHILLLSFELSDSLLLSSLKTVLDFVVPEHLDTSKSNLRLVLADELSKRLREAVLSTV
jgi:hypothetical protein